MAAHSKVFAQTTKEIACFKKIYVFLFFRARVIWGAGADTRYKYDVRAGPGPAPGPRTQARDPFFKITLLAGAEFDVGCFVYVSGACLVDPR